MYDVYGKNTYIVINCYMEIRKHHNGYREQINEVKTAVKEVKWKLWLKCGEKMYHNFKKSRKLFYRKSDTGGNIQ